MAKTEVESADKLGTVPIFAPAKRGLSPGQGSAEEQVPWGRLPTCRWIRDFRLNRQVGNLPHKGSAEVVFPSLIWRSLPCRSKGLAAAGGAVQEPVLFKGDRNVSRHFGFMVLVGLLALFCAGPASAQIAPAYYVTNIGQLPNGVLGSGIGNFGYAMSNSGNYVTGIGLYPWNPANGFNQGMGYYYNGSTVSPLASTVLSGWANNYEWPGVPVWNPNQPNGVNNSGIVVGQYNNSAFYSLQGVLPVTIPGFPDGVGPMAYSINDNGLIVGDWDTQNNGGYAGFMYNLNTNTLTQLPGFAAFSVNDKGEMAGCGGGGINTGPAGRNGNPASYGYGEWRDAGGNLYTIPTMMQATAIDSSGTYICGQGSDASASPTLQYRHRNDGPGSARHRQLDLLCLGRQ